MTNKFKIGDKVKVIGGFNIGALGVITDIPDSDLNFSYNYVVGHASAIRFGYFEYELEHAYNGLKKAVKRTNEK